MEAVGFFKIYFLIFWLRHAPCGILVPQPGIEPVPRALEVQRLNHWTAREVPGSSSFLLFSI